MSKKAKLITWISVIATLVLTISLTLVLVLVNKGKLEEDKIEITFVVGDAINADSFNTISTELDSYTLSEPKELPQSVNMFFEGWYKDADYSAKAEFPLNITADTTLYAKYLEGTLPKENIAFDATNNTYYVIGRLKDNSITTLVIPDIYDNGINGVSTISYIENISNTSSLLTNNPYVRQVYIGNNIDTVTEYFAFNSPNINLVTFGQSMESIHGSAFSKCTALATGETRFSSEGGWLDIDSSTITSTQLTWIRKAGATIVFHVSATNSSGYEVQAVNKSLFTATKYYKGDTDSPINEDGTINISKPTVLPAVANFRFVNWYANAECTTTFDFDTSHTPDTETTEVNIYASYQEGNLPASLIGYNSAWCNDDYTYGAYYVKTLPQGVTDSNSLITTDTLIIPDCYDDGDNGVKPLAYMDNSSDYIRDDNNKFGILTDNTCVKEVYVGNNITNIQNYFAYYCSNLNKVLLPAKLVSIGDNAFTRTKITSINLPNNLISIGEYAFSSTTLSSINIPNSVGKIETGLFKDCQSLNSVTLPEGILSIGDSAFSSATSLKNILLPESVICIGDSAFKNSGLEGNITFSTKVDEIGDYAYANTKITSITFTSDIDSLGEGVCQNCDSLQSATVNGVNIPDETFRNCNNLTSVNLMGDIKIIGASAFNYCSALTKIKMPDSVTTIGSDLFAGCSSLELKTGGLELSNNITSLPARFLCDGTSNGVTVTEFVVPDAVTSIEVNAFSGMRFNSLTIGANVTNISDVQFIVDYISADNNKKYYASNNALIERNASGDIVIKGTKDTHTLPSSVAKIGDWAFWSSEIEYIELHSGITHIGDNAFSSCAKLKGSTVSGTTFYIPSSVYRLGVGAFSSCGILKSVYFADGVTYENIDSRTSDSTGVTEIPAGCFYGCINLTEVILPESYVYSDVYEDDYSLIGTSLITVIGDRAFYGCNNLGRIEYADRVIEIGEKAFYNCANFGMSDSFKSLRFIKKDAFYGTKVSSVTIWGDSSRFEYSEDGMNWSTTQYNIRDLCADINKNSQIGSTGLYYRQVYWRVAS